jgi:peptidoglycan hydrolase-like protein with peptidoglycan-binding domain
LNLGLVIDGQLGSKTVEVIKVWQGKRGLVPDGLVGNETKAMMNGQIRDVGASLVTITPVVTPIVPITFRPTTTPTPTAPLPPPPTTSSGLMYIPGCDTRTTGFSSINSQSCANNIPI